MSKSKIMAIVIAAVVVIAGVGVAVPILRNRIKPENETTTVMEAKTRASLEEESTTVAPESESTTVEQLTNEKGEVVTDSQGKPVDNQGERQQEHNQKDNNQKIHRQKHRHRRMVC